MTISQTKCRGQQRRVAIARALSQPAAYDPQMNQRESNFASSSKTWKLGECIDQEKSLILITHDNGIAAQARRVSGSWMKN